MLSYYALIINEISSYNLLIIFNLRLQFVSLHNILPLNLLLRWLNSLCIADADDWRASPYLSLDTIHSFFSISSVQQVKPRGHICSSVPENIKIVRSLKAARAVPTTCSSKIILLRYD